MTALVLMRQGDGWGVFRNGARLTEPLPRAAALELVFRLAASAAHAGGAVSMVVDEGPAGPAAPPAFGFRMEPEQQLYFRPREPRSFETAEHRGSEVIAPPRSPA